MNYQQITIFYPNIIKVGGKYSQSIKTETHIENPTNKQWYIFQYSKASGQNWQAIIGDSNIDAKYSSINFTRYSSYKQFFIAKSQEAKCSPVVSKHAYLTAAGAAQHNLFYALKIGNDVYQNIGVTQYLDGSVKPDETNVVPVQLLPNGQIVELLPNTTLPKRFVTVNDPFNPNSINGLSNLHLAQEALKSTSPDTALLLQALMVEVSLQSSLEDITVYDMALGAFVKRESDINRNEDLCITPAQINMINILSKQAGGYWLWIDGECSKAIFKRS
jgi:hypothetical protein